MRRLSRVALGLAATAAANVFAPALAADLPAPGQTVPAPAPPWGGFYLGGFAGGAFGDASQGYSVTSTWVSANLPSLIPFVNSAGSQGLGLRGTDVGVEAGYDWTVADRYVVGVVGDVNWSDLNSLRATDGTLPIISFPYSITQSLSSDWRGSLRLRAGYTPLDNLLVYATGGLAYGHFTYANSFWDNLEPPFLPGNEAESAVFRAWRPGWTIGAGAEWAFNANWSLKGEYRFSEYAPVSGTGFLPLQQPPSNGYIAHSSGDIRLNELRAGVDYRFN